MKTAYLTIAAGRVLKRQPIPGLYHATASLRGLLRGGFGRLGLQKQPHPADNPVVLLFVVGGVSMLELREVCQEIDSQQSPDGKQIQLLIGSAALLRPDDLYQNMIGGWCMQVCCCSLSACTYLAV